MNDVEATVKILTFTQFWNKRKDYIKCINWERILALQTNSTAVQANDINDSDTDDESNSDDSVEAALDSDSESDDEFSLHWHRNTNFTGFDSKSKFCETFQNINTRNAKTQPTRLGVQVAFNSVKSVMKSWRYIFTDHILNKIVKYTNDYGGTYCKDWNDLCKTDITDFVSILFIASIQKRKDKSTHWFSEDPMLENTIVKKIMSGNKFHKLLRYLHVCDMYRQPDVSRDDYDPIYKVQELKDMLEVRYNNAFVPGYALSLDESLIRCFGRLKFKVRIITKSARYGIKVYVIADAATAYVLKVIFYTGKFTYHVEADSIAMKKTVQIVKKLCEAYRGSHRCVYIDRFYTSIDLMHELDKMDLYVTGTCMKNRLPKELRMNKNKKEYKEMNRGDYKSHLYKYVMIKETGEQVEKKYGLVCWKDKDIVYALTNCVDTTKTDTCFRRSSEGRITLQRPCVISEYNNNMGGVDLADMRRLHCNSTVMGLKRWWMKIFFYLLDVGTSNALVLFREAMNSNMNVVEYKKQLVNLLIGSRLETIDAPIVQHKLVRVEGDKRLSCAYCSAFFINTKRTRYICQHPQCRLPLCSVGSNKDNDDCFALAHRSEEMRKALCKRLTKMQNKSNNRPGTRRDRNDNY